MVVYISVCTLAVEEDTRRYFPSADAKERPLTVKFISTVQFISTVRDFEVGLHVATTVFIMGSAIVA